MERASQGNLNPKSPTLSDKNESFSSHHRPDDHGGCKTDLDHDSTSELSIFNAHKYFNDVTNNDILQKVTITNNNNRVSPLLNMDQQHKQNTEAEKDNDITNTTRSYSYSYSAGGYTHIKNYKAHSFHASTSTPPSSKVGLLSHPPTNAISVTTRNPSHSSDLRKKIKASLLKPIWLLRRKCPCSDKNSVQVKENTPKPKTQVTTTTSSPTPQNLSHNQIVKDSVNHNTPEPDHKAVNSQRFQFQPVMNQVPSPLSEGFTFPLFLATTNSPTKPQVVLNVVHEEEPSRDSLQVFQPPSPPKSRIMEDDAASDASSDLFEIESFSTQATTFTYPIRECHEPITEAATIHNFFASNPSNTQWWQQQRDAVVPPPQPLAMI
ncbi:hypothetical protein SESBI_17132 [Sesbania bispinosa]|nr:hypothetical protein SESBI_17132 [Sesbania bispinosa]